MFSQDRQAMMQIPIVALRMSWRLTKLPWASRFATSFA
jgi:hypothetical protein